MFNGISGNKVVNVLSNDDYTSSSSPFHPYNEPFLAGYDIRGNESQCEIPRQSADLPTPNTYSFFNSMYPSSLSAPLPVEGGLYDIAPMQIAERGYFVTTFNPLEVSHSIDNSSLLQPLTSNFQHNTLLAPLNLDLNTPSHISLGQEKNNSQLGQSQSSSYAGAYESYSPRQQIGASLIPSAHQYINQLLPSSKAKYSEIKKDIIKGAENLKKSEKFNEIECQNYINKSLITLNDEGLNSSSISDFIKIIEIILYGEIKEKKYDSTKFDLFREKCLQRAIILKYKPNATQEERKEFLRAEICDFQKKGASSSTTYSFSTYLEKTLNENEEIEKCDSAILSKFIIFFINLKNNKTLTEEIYISFIDELLSILEEEGASDLAISDFFKDLDIIFHGEEKPNKNYSKKYSLLVLKFIEKAKDLISNKNAKEEDFILHVREAILAFEAVGASSSAVSRLKQRLNGIFYGETKIKKALIR